MGQSWKWTDKELDELRERVKHYDIPLRDKCLLLGAIIFEPPVKLDSIDEPRKYAAIKIASNLCNRVHSAIAIAKRYGHKNEDVFRDIKV